MSRRPSISSMEEKRPLLYRRPSLRDDRPLHQRRLACVLVLLTELLERLAFYATSFNLVMFLNQEPLNWTTLNASYAEFTLSAFAFGFCFFAGYLADARLGRYRTIVIFYVVLLIGYGCMILSEPHHSNLLCSVTRNDSDTINWSSLTPAEHRLGNMTPFVDPTDMDFAGNPPCKAAVYVSLVLVGLGTAAIRTNIAPFGADQVRTEGPDSMRMFFNWLYWSINLGSLIAIFCMTFLDQVAGYFWGFVATLLVVVVSLLTFLSGTGCYVRRKGAPGTRPFLNTFGVIYSAIKNKRRRRYEVVNDMDVTQENSIYPALPQATSSTDTSAKPKTLLDYAMLQYGGKYNETIVQDTKFLLKILLIFASIVPYWTVYFQMNTTYLLQGLHMRITKQCSRIQPEFEFHIPPVWLSAFDIICTIIFIPVVDRLVYRTLDRKGYPLSLRGRIAIGMGFTILSVLCAGVLEHYRLAVYWEGNVENMCVQTLGNTTYYAADLSVFWQVPQYALIGVSEIFTSIAGMELAYAAAPKNMQGITMGLFLLFSGLGALLGTGTLLSFHNVWFFDWDSGNINCRFRCAGKPQEICAECHLDYYFYFLAGFQFVGLVLFLTLSYVLRIGYICPGSERNLASSVNRRAERQTSDYTSPVISECS